MSESVAPEFARFVREERRASRLPAASRLSKEGELAQPVFVEQGRMSEFLRVAARRAVGWFRPTRRTEVVWVQGESELAVNIAAVDVKPSDGLIIISLPVRCDQTGDTTIEVVLAVGSEREPAALYASTYRRPNGPAIIVDTWGEALVAFAWQVVLEMVSGIAAAIGKDSRGNVLVPVEMTASKRGLQIVPMARYRFAGSSGLRPSITRRGAP